MKKAKAPRVPVLENAFEVNLPKVMRAARATGDSRVVLDDGNVRTVAMLTETRLAVFLDGRPWVADVVSVQCLNGRLRPLLKCPRAHEGNFQSLYYRAGELACRYCHTLRYRSNLSSGVVARARLQRNKLLVAMGASPDNDIPKRASGTWRRRYLRLATDLADLGSIHYEDLRQRLQCG